MKKNRFDKRASEDEEVELLLVEDEAVILDGGDINENKSADMADEEVSDVLGAEESSQSGEEMVETLGGPTDASVGKSFRSRELTVSDLEQKKVSSTFEDKWVDEDTGSGWIMKLVLLCVLALTSAGVWAFLNLDDDEVDVENDQVDQVVAEQVVEVIDYETQLQMLADCVKKYLESETIEERAKYCRHSEATLAKMKRYYSGDKVLDTYSFKEIVKSIELRKAGKIVSFVTASVSNEAEDQKTFMIEHLADGGYVVDWELAVVYQPGDWEAFIKDKDVNEQAFRVELRERINYGPYLYEFDDDSKYQAYRVSLGTDEDKFLLAYAEKDSLVDKQLKYMHVKHKKDKKKADDPIQPILKLAFPENAFSDQCVMITEVLSSTWYLP